MSKFVIDYTRGFDVMVRRHGSEEVVEHYNDYKDAKKKAEERKSYFLRYWSAKE